MDELLEAGGAESCDYAAQDQVLRRHPDRHDAPRSGVRLSHILLKEATRKGADAIATLCPLCQFNLDAYQDKIAQAELRAGEYAGCLLHAVAGAGRSGWANSRELGFQRSISRRPASERRVVRRARRRSTANVLRTNGASLESASTSAIAARTSPARSTCKAVAEYAARLPNVVVARDYKYMCSDPGQELIASDIREHKLNRIVVASCSPLLHEETFRTRCETGGLNPFFFQMVNIREHDSWVHTDKAAATEKAKDLVRAAVRRVGLPRALEKGHVSDPPRRAGGRRRHRRHPRRARRWPTPASRSIWSSASPPSAGTWRSSTRPSRRSTAPPAS